LALAIPPHDIAIAVGQRQMVKLMRRCVRKDGDDAVSDYFFLIAKVLRNWQFTVVELEVALIGRLDVAYGPRST
jgi:hypothetical protein